MTSESSAIDVDAREWAMRMLNRDDSRRIADIPSLLRLVNDSGYFLPAELANAAQIVAGASALSDCPSIVNQAAWNGRHELLREQIAEFRRIYFDLSCEERTRQWNGLVVDCADYSDLAAALRRLNPGLDVSLPLLPEDSRLHRLSQICQDIFLASPRIAACLRLSFGRQWQAETAAWNRVIRGLSKEQFNSFQSIAPWMRNFRWKQLRLRLYSQWQRVFDFLKSPKLALLVSATWVLLALTLPDYATRVTLDDPMGWFQFFAHGLIAAFIAWQKGNQPWCWLLSGPLGILVSAALPIPGYMQTRDLEATKQRQRFAKNAGWFLSGLMAFYMLIVFYISWTIWTHPQSHDRSSRGGIPYSTRNPAWPPHGASGQRFADPATSEKVRDAAFEATRILMGLPEDLSPEQRKLVERGFQIPEPRGSGE